MTKKSIKEVKSVHEILSDIKHIDALKHPSISTYLNLDKYFAELIRGVKIARKYADGNASYEAAQMSEDLMILSAIHVSTAECVGYVQGYARRAEDARKIQKSNYALHIRKAKDNYETANQNYVVQVSEADLDNASRILSKEQYLEACDAEIISNMAKSMWYSIGDFIKILNSAINRAFQELPRINNGPTYK